MNKQCQDAGETDICVIGAGAAGLSAAMYGARKGLVVKVISADIGGQANLIHQIENYPGAGSGKGYDVMQTIFEQAISFGANFIVGKVVKVKNHAKSGQSEDVHKNKPFEIITADNLSIRCNSVIIASGRMPRLMGLEGEESLLGKGICTCITCDGPLYKGKRVGVVGNSRNAVNAGTELCNYADKVFLISETEDDFELNDEKMQKVQGSPKKILIDNVLKGLVIQTPEGQEKKLLLDGLFLQLGNKLDASFATELVDLNAKGEIIVDARCKTKSPGVFACGDATNIPYKQVIICAGEGAKAGLEAARYISGGAALDWKH